jgi:hypothetical protein
MRFKYNEGDEKVIVEHRGDILIFVLTASFKKTDHVRLGEPYRDLNKWFSEQTQEIQQALFDVYRKISLAYTEVANPNALAELIHVQVQELYRYVTYESISSYVDRTPLTAPPDLKTAHSPNDRTPARTYLVKDYWELVKLALALRAALPIFSRYIDIVSRISGIQFKEREAALLLEGTWIMTSEAVERLRVFIAHLAPVDDLPPTAIHGGMSKGIFPEWMLAMTLIRRVAVGEIDSSLDKGSLVANVYGYIGTTYKGMLTRFGGQIGNSSKTSDYNTDDNSLFLRSRVKQDTATVDMVAVEVSLENALASAQMIDPEITIHDLLPFENTAAVFPPGTIGEFHVAICSWVFNPIVPGLLMRTIKQQDLLPRAIITATRALLWKWGHHELSLLLSAPFKEQDDSYYWGFVSSSPRFPSDLSEKIRQAVPFNAKKPIPDRNKKKKTSREVNYAYDAIANVKDTVPMGLWQVKVPDGFSRPEYVDINGNMSTPPTIHRLLAQLFLDIAKRSESQ